MENFDVDKIVTYLDKFKSELSNLYSWDINHHVFSKLDELSIDCNGYFNKPNLYENTIDLKMLVSKKLQEFKTFNKRNEFHKLCSLLIRDWGGIRSSKEENTQIIIDNIFDSNEINYSKIPFKRIASSSKILSFLNPEKYVIYDSRISYSLNWIILTQQAGNKFFPIPEGRNSRMRAFDV
ncbi:MAG: hypothetical protein KKD31_12605, partial [Bacteroidetes bacterium]|nr:hypothetical protein [Bacteroidota bacterium]